MRGEIKEKKKQTAKQTGIRGSNLCLPLVRLFHRLSNFTGLSRQLYTGRQQNQPDQKQTSDLEGEPISCPEWLKSAML